MRPLFSALLTVVFAFNLSVLDRFPSIGSRWVERASAVDISFSGSSERLSRLSLRSPSCIPGLFGCGTGEIDLPCFGWTICTRR